MNEYEYKYKSSDIIFNRSINNIIKDKTYLIVVK